MIKNPYKLIYFIIILLLIEAYSFSQDGYNPGDLFLLPLDKLMDVKIVSVSKHEQYLYDAPATVYAVTQDQILNRGYFSLDELLEDIPGIEIQRNSSSEFNMFYSLRGIQGNEKCLILMDGFRISSPAGTPHAVGENYSLENVKRVEVILGPGSSLYGVDAFSGIINIVTKTGEDWQSGELKSSFGSFYTSRNSLTYGNTFSDGKGSYVFSVSSYYTDSPFWPDYYPDEYQYYTDVYSQTGEMDLFGTPVTLEIFPLELPVKAGSIHGHLKYKNCEFGYSKNYESHNTGTGCGPEFSILRKDVVHAISVEKIYGHNTHQSSDKIWKLQTSISNSTFKLHPNTKWLNLYTAFRDGWEYGLSNSFKIEEQIDFTLNKNFSVIGGFSYEDINALPKTNDLPFKFDEDKSTCEQDIPYMGTDGLIDINGESLEILQEFYNINYQNYGSYFQLQLFPNKVWQFTIGSRYDYNTRYGSSINPRTGIVVTPMESLKFKLMYGEAYLDPSPYKSYYHYGTYFPLTNDDGEIVDVMSGFMHLPNPELEPERLRTFEGGFIYSATQNIVLSMSSYYTKIKNLIVRNGSEEFEGEFRGKIVSLIERPGNIGSQMAYGFTPKIDAMVTFGNVHSQIYVSYNYIDGYTKREKKTDLLYSAKHTIKGGVDIKWNRLSVSPRFIYRSKSKHINPESSSDSYAVVNLFIRYRDLIDTQFLKGTVFLKGNNLLDTKYYNVLEGAPGELEAMKAAPQNPITISGGLSLSF